MTHKTLAMLLGHMPQDDNDKLLRSEGDLRTELTAYLQANGWNVEERVKCAAGEADLVARQDNQVGIIEIKLALTRRALYESASQVLAYRMAIDPAADAIVIGYERPGTETAIAAVESLGVAVVKLKDEFGMMKRQDPAALSLQPSAFSLPTSSLQWNVNSFAQSQGITTVAQLVQATDLPKQSLYSVWKGETSQISVAVLGRLCLGLDARTGDWFVWEGEGEERRLAWNIAVVAGRMGLTAPQLAFRAGIYYRMIQLYWQGTTQSVFIQTLGKLARALAAEEDPFDIGDLFTWRVEPGTAELNSVGPRPNL